MKGNFIGRDFIILGFQFIFFLLKFRFFFERGFSRKLFFRSFFFYRYFNNFFKYRMLVLENWKGSCVIFQFNIFLLQMRNVGFGKVIERGSVELVGSLGILIVQGFFLIVVFMFCVFICILFFINLYIGFQIIGM